SRRGLAEDAARDRPRLPAFAARTTASHTEPDRLYGLDRPPCGGRAGAPRGGRPAHATRRDPLVPARGAGAAGAGHRVAPRHAGRDGQAPEGERTTRAGP